ncbi:hypothetical protein H7R39_05785 [Campylobacter sp. Marseille-Q3452]|uniref:Uncharacterized protein n=1 Tax=Campylobacter massiliensis TaxID=2762557 RepID=A0A842J9I5_9BACT|nr:hypothetical protein [Campylobacter massiliensis]
MPGKTRIKFTRSARGKIKFIKRKSLQKYRQKAGRFADENFILNLARGAGKFDAQKGLSKQIYAQDKIKFSAQNTIKFNQKAA